MEKMRRVAKKVLSECMNLKEDESYLVITDEATHEVGRVLYEQGREMTRENYFMMVPCGKEATVSTPKLAETALRSAPDVIMIPTKRSYTHMDATTYAWKNGSRIATLPGITKDIFKRTLDIDYGELRERGEILISKLEKAERVKIKTKSGTNLKMKIPNRILPDLGKFNEPGEYGNLPAGEVFTAPDKDEVNGKIVIDSMQDIANPKTELIVYKGKVQEVEGDDGFKEKLWGYRNGRRIAELGIGLNPKATITGNILEDEKVMGTCHVALGKNINFGGKVDSEIHWDAILIKPDIWLDGEKIMDSGKMVE